MQRYKKPSLLKVYNPFTDLEGHIFAFGRVGCLDSKTEIYTFDKKLCKKKLGELPKSFKVLSYNFKKKKKEIKDAKLISTGYKECFEIELENGKKVIATNEHKFFNESGDEIEVKNLNIGDSLLFDKSGSQMKSSKIKSITPIGKKQTYDLQVVDNHNFFLTNGILSHNSGKCHPKGNQVLLINGEFKDVSEIKLGDQLISPNNKISKVIQVHEFFSEENYALYHKGKKLYSCSKEHLIPIERYTLPTINVPAQKLFQGKYKNRTLTFQGDLIKTFYQLDPEIDPYSLGVWLGDGRFKGYARKKCNGFNYHLEITSANNEIMKRVIKKYNCISIGDKKGTDAKAWRFSTKGPLAKDLQELKLKNCMSKTKFIPQGCLRADWKFRKALLEGLIDTDGYVDVNGCLEYTSKSKRLMEDLLYLIRTLGGNGRITAMWKTCQSFKRKRKYYRMSINMGEFRTKLKLSCKMKRERLKKYQGKYNPQRVGFELKKDKPCQVYGFTLDSKEQLYFVNDFVITHNSVSLFSIIQGFHDNHKYKVFDLFGGERHEGVYWCLPSKQTSYWAKFNKLGRVLEEGPKKYKVNLLVPFFESKLPKKMPKEEGRINSILFTIPFKDIEETDVRLVIGSLSEESRFILKELQHMATKKDNPGSILNMAKKLKATSTLFYKNFLLPLMRNKLIMDSYCDNNIDIIAEAKDKEVISTLILDFLPEEFHLFVINYIIRKLNVYIDDGKIPKKNIVFLRESATFFKATDDSVSPDRYKIFRKVLSHHIRMGRRGISFSLDTQSSREVKGLVSGSEDFLLIFNMTGMDRMAICELLRKEKRITSRQEIEIPRLEKGQCMVVEQKKNAKHVQIILPRTEFWQKSHGNFYKTVWPNYANTWTYLEEQIDYVIQRCKDMEEKVIKAVAKVPVEIAQQIEQPIEAPIQPKRKSKYVPGVIWQPPS